MWDNPKFYRRQFLVALTSFSARFFGRLLISVLVEECLWCNEFEFWLFDGLLL